MPDVVLSPGEQAALSALLAAEPVPGSPLPETRVLELLTRLIPCDAVGGYLYEASGRLTATIDLPSGFLARIDQYFDEPYAGYDQPLTRATGVKHMLNSPCGALLGATGVADSLHAGFITADGHLVDLWLDRTRRVFTARDVAVLAMLAPLLRKLVSERATSGRTDSLTRQERRVLKLVAGGLSNAQIAQHMTVAPSTVRKHLEHAYRKLGVSSRLAAIAALQCSDDPTLDLRGRVERFA